MHGFIRNLISSCLVCVLTVVSHVSFAEKVGIVGDSHGHDEILEKSILKLKSLGVTRLILMGDLVSWRGDVASLEKTLSRVQRLSGLSRDSIEFLLGNAEAKVLGEWKPVERAFAEYQVTEKQLMQMLDENAISAKFVYKNFYERLPFPQTTAYSTIQQYATLHVAGPEDYSVIEVDGRKIAASHYNNRPLPEKLLQPDKVEVQEKDPKTGEVHTVIKNFRREHTVDEKRLSGPIPAGSDIAFYGDLHIGGYFIDAESKTLVVNPGVLDPKAKDIDEPQAFAVYDTRSGIVQHFDANTGKQISRVDSLGVKKVSSSNCAQLAMSLVELIKK